MSNDNNDLPAALELWEAMGEVEGLRPLDIKQTTPKSFAYNYGPTGKQFDNVDCWVRVKPQYILHILTGHAQDWLRERGWNSISPGESHDVEWEHEPRGTGYLPIPEAIRAEAGRGRWD